jgi:hypothetical protein
MLLNDAFMQQQAAGFANRICGEANSPAQVKKAYGIAFNRSPSEKELETAVKFLVKNERSFDALF